MAAAIPFILVAATVASTAYSVYSSYEAGEREEEAQSDYARQQALQMQAAKKDEMDRRRRVLATQEARYAASGVEMEGTPLLVQAETIRESEENLRRIMLGGGYGISGARRAGEQAEKASYARMGSSLLQGAGSVYNIGRGARWWT